MSGWWYWKVGASHTQHTFSIAGSREFTRLESRMSKMASKKPASYASPSQIMEVRMVPNFLIYLLLFNHFFFVGVWATAGDAHKSTLTLLEALLVALGMGAVWGSLSQWSAKVQQWNMGKEEWMGYQDLDSELTHHACTLLLWGISIGTHYNFWLHYLQTSFIAQRGSTALRVAVSVTTIAQSPAPHLCAYGSSKYH